MALFDAKNININTTILELINRRRRQIVVHSYLYYKGNTSLITDYQFDLWCKELVELHKNHPRETEKAVFPEAFAGWEGFSGYDLFSKDTMTEVWARLKAFQLTSYNFKE